MTMTAVTWPNMQLEHRVAEQLCCIHSVSDLMRRALTQLCDLLAACAAARHHRKHVARHLVENESASQPGPACKR